MNQRKLASLPTALYARIQNENTDQEVKDSPGWLHRIIASNASGTAGTVTIEDDVTVITVLEVPANSSTPFEFGIPISTSLHVTPSAVALDILVVYD